MICEEGIRCRIVPCPIDRSICAAIEGEERKQWSDDHYDAPRQHLANRTAETRKARGTRAFCRSCSWWSSCDDLQMYLAQKGHRYAVRPAALQIRRRSSPAIKAVKRLTTR